ncbi:MAG: carbohydrate ABC transporter permease [Chloroflexota bacterium]|nr:MAG: carbohydrate ABC transporter permease [Chloroflexota bacterium]
MTAEIGSNGVLVDGRVYGGVRRGPLWYAQRFLVYATLVFLSAIFLVPLFWIVSTSLKEQGQVFVFPPQWLPDPWMWENYPEAMRRAPLWTWLRNTATITVFATAGNVVVSSMVAFGFARLRFPFRDTLFVLLLSTMMLPPIVTLIPRFVMFRELGWIDTFLPFIVPAWFGGGAFNIFLVRQYYLTLPLDLDEAAKIDGASNWLIWWNVIVPLSYPVLIAIGIFSFVHYWNDFLDPLIFLGQESLKTLSLGLRAFINPYDASWHITMAASMWLIVPMIAIFFVGQRYFIKGVAMSGITGR